MNPLCERCGHADAAASCQTCRTGAGKPTKLCQPCADRHHADHEVRLWTNPEPTRKLLGDFLCRIDQSAAFLLERAAECTHKPGSGYFAAINAGNFGLARYDGRLAVMFPKGVPTLYQDVHVHACEKREVRAKCVRRGHIMWAERDGTPPPEAELVDGQSERLTQYLSIVPAGTHAAVPTLRLRYAETGGKTTLKGYGRQWSGGIVLPPSVAWSFAFTACCRSGRINAEAQLYIAEEAAEIMGRLFATQSLAAAATGLGIPPVLATAEGRG